MVIRLQMVQYRVIRQPRAEWPQSLGVRWQTDTSCAVSKESDMEGLARFGIGVAGAGVVYIFLDEEDLVAQIALRLDEES